MKDRDYVVPRTLISRFYAAGYCTLASFDLLSKTTLYLSQINTEKGVK